MNRTTDPLTVVRAKALFTSPLSARSKPDRAEVAAAIRLAVRAHGGTRGCTIAVAGEYGDHPDTAAPRMRWALAVVTNVYPKKAAAAESGTAARSSAHATVAQAHRVEVATSWQDPPGHDLAANHRQTRRSGRVQGERVVA